MTFPILDLESVQKTVPARINMFGDIIRNSLFMRGMKKYKIKSPSFFTEGVEATLIRGQHDSTSISITSLHTFPHLPRVLSAVIEQQNKNGLFFKLIYKPIAANGYRAVTRRVFQ